MPRILSFDLGFRNLSYCMITFEEGYLPVIEVWDNIVLTEIRRPTTSQVVEAGSRFVQQNEWTYLAPQIVVFEAQMKVNPKMQKLASAIHSAMYALAHEHGNTQIRFEYVKPILKFNYFVVGGTASASLLNDPDKKMTAGQLYKWRKQTAVKLCKEFLREWGDTEFLSFYTNTCNESPDMADSMTNACAFVTWRRLW